MNVIKLGGIRIHAPLTRLQTGTTVSYVIVFLYVQHLNLSRCYCSFSVFC